MANHQAEMVEILRKVHQAAEIADNALYPEAGLAYIDSALKVETNKDQLTYYRFMRGKLLLAMGTEEKAIEQLELLVADDKEKFTMLPAWKELALAYLRLGERSNCISNHAAESCILPIKGVGVHANQTGSTKAIEVYKKILEKNPSDLESRWLLNLAYMTLGDYPKGVPPSLLIPKMEGDTTYKVNPFTDVAADLKLDVNNLSGGSIVDDFDNDGYLDVLTTSGWESEGSVHYFKNTANGFTELTDRMGVKGITGGLNMMQTDYNNDGFIDVFILRGGWKRDFGNEPNSLLRNNGNGTFTDVTIESGLLSYHPTQTATWNDFNNDGWVDVFIGNESYSGGKGRHACELYINNQDGTFTDIAKKANCEIFKYVKGVTSGDYNHDGWQDIFISTVNGQRMLLKNEGSRNVTFTDVTINARLDLEQGNTFPTWFWDFDNDGWLDIFACDYTYKETLGVYEASEKLNIPAGNPEKMLLYKNNHDGTFTNVAKLVGLTTNVFAMGSNFGDIDNDGFLDMYLGTGNPDYKSVIPNKLFRNVRGERFQDVTASARVGHLQKGHGVSFADMDNDGDQDIYIEMGGVYPGDTYQNSFFLNPGQNTNHWICLKLEGVKSNRAAIGSQVKLTFHEDGKVRSVYRDVNSGGSFGSSPFRREIGIGQATMIDEIEIRWHGSNEVQTFKNVKPDQFLRITEGQNSIEPIALKRITWTLPERLCLPFKPNLAKR
ncbi:MAG TPA: FG-GAP-like repeat-containing protein [Cyclobacteriaceae bacterium]|nr:FG-GAP-like repeat-containing protein [Cyclobacteriaceae bacterium]